MDQLALSLAPREFEPRAKAAADHADRVSSDWSGRAASLFIAFATRTMGAPFLTEHAATYARAKGLEDPPDGRAWGAVAVSLRRAGRIVSAGYGRAHDGSPKTLWRLAP